MKKAYIIETIRIPQILTKKPHWPLSQSQQPQCWKADQEWERTLFDEEEARAVFAGFADDPTVVAAALIEWTPGRLEPNATLKHGSYSSRGCAGGVPVQTVLIHGDREWEYCQHACGVESETREWRTYPGGQQPTTQPAPGFRLSWRGDGILWMRASA